MATSRLPRGIESLSFEQALNLQPKQPELPQEYANLPEISFEDALALKPVEAQATAEAPAPVVAPSVAPPQATGIAPQPMFGEFPAPYAPAPDVGVQPDTSLVGSVMYGAPSVPMKPEPKFDPEIKKAYDIATPQERQKLVSGDIRFAELDQYYQQKDKEAESLLKRGTPFNPYAGDTRYERREPTYIQAGVDEDALRKKEYAFDENAQGYKVIGNVLHRAALKGMYGLAESGGGQQRFLAEAILGIDPKDTIKTLDYINQRQEAIGDPQTKKFALFENAVSSIIQQAPGLMTGTSPAALTSMFLNQFGQTYNDGRTKKLDMAESAVRASAFAAFEVLGEKLGLGDTLKGIKAAARGVPDKELSSFFVKALAKEIPGEQLTYAGQFFTDKAFQLNPEAGLKAFIDGAVDTLGATIAQGGLMLGGAGAVNKVRQQYGDRSETARATDAAELAKQNALAKAEYMFNPPAKEAGPEATTAAIKETQQEEPALTKNEFGYLDTPAYQEASSKREELVDEWRKLTDAADKFGPDEEGRYDAIKKSNEFYTNNIDPLDKKLDAIAADRQKTEATPASEQAAAPVEKVERTIAPESDLQDTQQMLDELNLGKEQSAEPNEISFEDAIKLPVSEATTAPAADQAPAKATETWEQSPFADRINGYLKQLEDAGENTKFIRKDLERAAKLGQITEESVAFRENYARQVIANKARDSGNIVRPEVETIDADRLDKISSNVATSLPVEIQQAAITKLNNLYGRLADLGYKPGEVNNGTPSREAREIQLEINGILHSLMLIAPARYAQAKGYKAFKQDKLDRLEKEASEYLGIDTKAYPGIDTGMRISTVGGRPEPVGSKKTTSAATGSSEALGVNSIPLSDPDGKPFTTMRAAQAEKRKNSTMRVVRVGGGFALAPKTEAQLAAQKKAAERLQGAGGNQALSAHELIAMNGGLAPNERAELGVEGNQRIGNKWLYAGQGKGMSIEDAAMLLNEYGYLDSTDHNAAYDLIRTSLKNPQYAMEDVDAMSEKAVEDRLEAEYQDYLDAQNDLDSPFASLESDGYTKEEIAESGFNEASEEVQKEVAALSAMAEAMGIDTFDIFDRAAQQTEGKSQDDYYANARRQIEQAIEEAQQRGAVVADQANVAPSSQDVLTAPTKEELTSKAESVEKAKKDQAAQDRLKEAEEQAERERREIEQRSHAAADTFELGQSGEDNLSGQVSIFNVAREVPALKEKTMDQMTRDEMIAEYARVRQRLAGIQRRFATDTNKSADAMNEKWLYEYGRELKDSIDAGATVRTTPEQFLARAARALAEGDISRDVFDVVQTIYNRNPNLLNGLRLSLRTSKNGATLGMFTPLTRLVTLFKGTEGVEDPVTIRHEITHSLEMAMTDEAQIAMVDAWLRALHSASKNAKTPEQKQFFIRVGEFLDKPTQESLDAAVGAMPDYNYYQYITPSEYWAVNAEPLLKANLGSGWQRFKMGVRGIFEAMKDLFGFDNKSAVHRTFRQVIHGNRITNNVLLDYVSGISQMYNVQPPVQENLPGVPPVQRTRQRNYRGDYAPPAAFNAPVESNKDSFVYRIQDKYIDTKRVQQAIKESGKEIKDEYDVYLQEELYHGRLAKEKSDFARHELGPILDEMKEKNISEQEIDDYLHNRHAIERNNFINEVNLDPDIQDAGSGIRTEDAKAYLDNLTPERKGELESVAKKIDKLIRGTQDILVKSGLETQETIDKWRDTYKNYVPLFREDLDFVNHGAGKMFEKGYGTRGSQSKRAVGSLKPVGAIFAKVVLQREAAYVRSERAKIGRALYALAISNPNPQFWLPVNPDATKSREKMLAELKRLGLDPSLADNLMQPNKQPYIDEQTGLVAYRSNPLLHNADNVFPVRINGKDRMIVFNSSDPRAMRMVTALRNLDAASMNWVMTQTGNVTRWMASVNTQYNPVFGIWNFMRDFGATQLNLSTTPLAGKKWMVNKNILPAWRGIYKDLRADRANKEIDSEWSRLWEDFQKHGGQTGYSEQFAKPEEKATIVARELKKRGRGFAKRRAAAVAGWLSDYNDTMENAMRLAVYKVAITPKSEGGLGLSKERAASIAKNISVNFNRKGSLSQSFGALYAFFNASVQGTARIGETLAGPTGKKIIAGGLLLGVAQALALALFGFGDDDIPDYVKDRNFVIPYGYKKYQMVPMPLGYSAIPATSRIITEWILSGFKDTGKRSLAMMEMLANSVNPLGGNSWAQTIAPTIVDPFMALYANKDAFGRTIYKEDRKTQPIPGHMRTKEAASEFSKGLAYFLNYITSGGQKYTKGMLSPTGDEIDYIIGQFTGGVGREALNLGKYISSSIKGEEVEQHKVPVAGKLLGDADSKTAVANRFYKNITKMFEYEHEIKQRQKNRENAYDVIRKNPEAALWERAKQVNTEVSKINKQRKEMMERKVSPQVIKNLERQRDTLMRQFNKLMEQRSQ